MTTRIPLDLGGWLSSRAARTPTRRALTFEGVTRTYAEFARRIDQMAAVLREGGVRHGDRVGYAGVNHPAFLETLFATVRLGAVFVPLNFRLAAAELEFVVNDAGLHTVVADDDRAKAIESVRGTTGLRRALAVESAVGLDDWEDYESAVMASEPIADAEPVDPDEVAVIMYTSGTTGRPKGAMLTHANLFWNNVNALHAMDILEQDVSLVCAPLFHIGGLNVTTLLTLQKGGEIILMPGFDPGQALELIPRYGVTTMFGVPAMFLFMSQHPEFADADLTSVRMFVCGGAPVPEALIKLYSGRGITFVQGYGLTETAPLALLLPAQDVLAKVGSAGLPPILGDVRIMDEHRRPVAQGERGEICVRGPNVMKGYWGRPDATAAAIDPEGWFHTGDVGVADEDGYVAVVDRVKDMIITGGENVYPAEVETVLYEHPAVAEVAVVGIPDERWGEAVTAVAALRPGAELELDALREFARQRLAGYKLPSRLEIVEELPRNPAGKVLKFELRERLSAR